jgi:dihydropyrimidinase
VIYDPEPEWVMSAGVLHMNTRFCPFEGFAVKGRVRTVLSRGAYLIKDDEFTGRPGWGRRVFRRFGG